MMFSLKRCGQYVEVVQTYILGWTVEGTQFNATYGYHAFEWNLIKRQENAIFPQN